MVTTTQVFKFYKLNMINSYESEKFWAFHLPFT